MTGDPQAPSISPVLRGHSQAVPQLNVTSVLSSCLPVAERLWCLVGGGSVNEAQEIRGREEGVGFPSTPESSLLAAHLYGTSVGWGEGEGAWCYQSRFE